MERGRSGLEVEKVSAQVADRRQMCQQEGVSTGPAALNLSQTRQWWLHELLPESSIRGCLETVLADHIRIEFDAQPRQLGHFYIPVFLFERTGEDFLANP